jgi:hypothetical protein
MIRDYLKKKKNEILYYIFIFNKLILENNINNQFKQKKEYINITKMYIKIITIINIIIIIIIAILVIIIVILVIIIIIVINFSNFTNTTPIYSK